MITLRYLIDRIMKMDDGFSKVAEHVLNLHPAWQAQGHDRVRHTYMKVSLELFGLQGDDELKDHVIELVSTDENQIDVRLAKGADVWSLDFVDWEQLIDLPIRDPVCSELSQRLAYVLYQITFWGVTRDAVLHERDQVQIPDDTDNLITVDHETFLQGLTED